MNDHVDKDDTEKYFQTESWAVLSASGPVIAGISWAFYAFLNVPTGWMMLGAACLFGLLAVNARHIKNKTEWLAVFGISIGVLFWQGALASTAANVGSSEPPIPDDYMPESSVMSSIGELFVSSAVGQIPSTNFTVKRNGNNYIVTKGKDTYTVPVSVYVAIVKYESKNRPQSKGFGVQWRK